MARVNTKLNSFMSQLMHAQRKLLYGCHGKGHMSFRCLNAGRVRHKDKQIIQGRLSFPALKQSSPRFLGQLVDLQVHSHADAEH